MIVKAVSMEREIVLCRVPHVSLFETLDKDDIEAYNLRSGVGDGNRIRAETRTQQHRERRTAQKLILVDVSGWQWQVNGR
jgi:hypothetical protein